VVDEQNIRLEVDNRAFEIAIAVELVLRLGSCLSRGMVDSRNSVTEHGIGGNLEEGKK
jgi:hypothetical protein